MPSPPSLRSVWVVLDPCTPSGFFLLAGLLLCFVGLDIFHVHVVPHVLLPLLSCLSSARLTEGPLAKGLQLVAGGWRPSAALLLLSPRRTGSGVGRSRVWLEAGSGLVGEGLLGVCPRILSVSGDVRDSQTLRA